MAQTDGDSLLVLIKDGQIKSETFTAFIYLCLNLYSTGYGMDYLFILDFHVPQFLPSDINETGFLITSTFIYIYIYIYMVHQGGFFLFLSEEMDSSHHPGRSSTMDSTIIYLLCLRRGYKYYL